MTETPTDDEDGKSNEGKKAYDDLGSLTGADLFEHFFEQMQEKADVETKTGVTKEKTVTKSRIDLVRSQKAKDLFKLIAAHNAGNGEWIIPKVIRSFKKS